MTDVSRLEAAADKQDIRDLIYTYCRAVDRLDIPLGEAIWHDDGLPITARIITRAPAKA